MFKLLILVGFTIRTKLLFICDLLSTTTINMLVRANKQITLIVLVLSKYL